MVAGPERLLTLLCQPRMKRSRVTTLDECQFGAPARRCPPVAGLLVLLSLALSALAGPWGSSVAAATADPLLDPLFEDISRQAGVDFVHFNGMTGEFYFPEMAGQGGAFLDYDGDGDLDLYLVQGALLGEGRRMEQATLPFRGAGKPSDRLLRNDSSAPGTAVRFTDVTQRSGITATGYGMGVATGDYDNDGWVDLYVTHYGANQLWRNLGDGTFREVTAEAGVDDPRWSTSAAFVDYDGDGWLDLYVVNYVDFSISRNPRCYAESSRRDYCGPSGFPSQSDRLLHNRGDGTFEDVSVRSGVGRLSGAGLGVVSSDFNGDGRVDLYVANDGEANFLWLNQGDGTFVDDALFAGVAVNRAGAPEASMGVDAGDFDGDGDDDLFMTHLMGESNTLFANLGGGLFEDRSIELGLAASSLPLTAFGTSWIDYDNDGWLDLLVLNGAVRILEELAQAGDPYPLDQPNQLFRNRAGQRFEETTAQAGEAFSRLEVSRGAALGDVDNDGDLDLLILNNSGPARLLRNRAADGAGWLSVRVEDSVSGRDLLGSRAILRREKGPVLHRRLHSDGGYCSARDPRAFFGLGKAQGQRSTISSLELISPRATRLRLVGGPAGRHWTIRLPREDTQ